MLKEYLKRKARELLRQDFDELFGQISELSDENMRLNEELEDANEKLGDPKYAVEKLLKRGITFFDNNALPYSEKKQYYIDAQHAIRNKTLTNEINHIVADTVEHIAKAAQDFNEVEKMRMQINFASLLQDRLASIQDPEQQKSQEDLNSII